MQDPFSCAACARKGPTCCQTDPAGQEYCFPLSAGEQEKIASSLQFPVAIKVQSPNSPGFVSRMKVLFPGERKKIEKLFPPEGGHDRLALDKQGACVFLEEHGCILPRRVRPLYCLLFPFWVMEGKIVLFSHPSCQAQMEDDDIRKTMHRLETTSEEILHLYFQLRRFWGIDKDL